MINTKKPFLLIDSSYVSFHRFFSTLIWYNNIYQKEEENDYDWSENPIFMKYFNETYMKSLLKFKGIYNVPFNQMIIVRDCPRETIWRMSIYPEYKATRKNTCSYKNKKYNIGNIFKHIYNKLYPELEELYGFKIVKIDKAEADDVIAVLANKITEYDKNRLIIIISNDNDYLQLVNQKTLIWSLQNKLLNTKVEMTVQEMLLRKILKGDESDNIPSLVGNMQEKEIIELIQNNDKFEEWLNKDKHRKLYENNQTLIDFNYIPSDLKDKILHECNDIIYGL
jgi:5'-3' exonuclease